MVIFNMLKFGRVVSFDNKKKKDMIWFFFFVFVIWKDYYFYEMWINFIISFIYLVFDINW